MVDEGLAQINKCYMSETPYYLYVKGIYCT